MPFTIRSGLIPNRSRDLSLNTLQWHHIERGGVLKRPPHDCLLKQLFRRRSKKTSKFRVTGLCEGNSPGIGEFPAQRASNAENVSIWWRQRYLIEVDSRHCDVGDCILRSVANVSCPGQNDMYMRAYNAIGALIFHTQGISQYRIYIRNSFKLKSRETSFAYNIHFSRPVVMKFSQTTAILLPCSVQNFKTIVWMKNTYWANEISQHPCGHVDGLTEGRWVVRCNMASFRFVDIPDMCRNRTSASSIGPISTQFWDTWSYLVLYGLAFVFNMACGDRCRQDIWVGLYGFSNVDIFARVFR